MLKAIVFLEGAGNDVGHIAKLRCRVADNNSWVNYPNTLTVGKIDFDTNEDELSNFQPISRIQCDIDNIASTTDGKNQTGLSFWTHNGSTLVKYVNK